MTPVELQHPPTAIPSVLDKLTALRALMQRDRLDGYFVPAADEHLNEYVPQAKQRRDWLSGFTGSAGDFLVTPTQTWLFVDSRYYEQAELQTNPAEIQVVKLGLEGQPTLVEVLETLGQEQAARSQRFHLGLDPFTLSIVQFRALQTPLELAGVELVSLPHNLVDAIRAQQPWVESDPLPPYADSPVFAVPEDRTGGAIAQKLTQIRARLTKARADALPLTKLDQIAWVFNLRGWDISYNPVFIAYALITADQAYLFTNLERIDADLQASLRPQVTLLPYDHYAATLTGLGAGLRVLVDPKHTTKGTADLLAQAVHLTCIEANNPVERLKAHKNPVEIAQMQAANLKASCAKTRLLKWLDDQQTAGAALSEWDVAQAMERFYQAESDFQGLSFNTIAAAGANSSIVHYGTPSPQISLQPGEFLLLDSGSQYLGGTTDDTRTVVIGTPSAEQITCYTEVLKAHINCAMQRFPKGTTGSQLDGITRSNLWFAGLDYGHGTGHGVGAFLNVHEGPNGISKRVQEPLEPGMVTSVEPGFYKSGWGGIRLENLYVVVDRSPTETHDPAAIRWYELESLTYIPFDRRLIDLDQLNSQQQAWLRQYYHAVIEKLSPLLSSEDVDWLHRTCQL